MLLIYQQISSVFSGNCQFRMKSNTVSSQHATFFIHTYCKKHAHPKNNTVLVILKYQCSRWCRQPRSIAVDCMSENTIVNSSNARFLRPSPAFVYRGWLSNTSVRSPLKTSLQQASTHTSTKDMQTASSNCSYMGVTAHWLDENFVAHNKCLPVHPGRHTTDFIQQQ